MKLEIETTFRGNTKPFKDAMLRVSKVHRELIQLLEDQRLEDEYYDIDPMLKDEDGNELK